MKRRNRVYVDTSVFGGVFDDAFLKVSRRFFEEVAEGKHVVLFSEVTSGELRDAPQRVQEFAVQQASNCLSFKRAT